MTLQRSQDRDTMDTGVPDGTEAEDLSEPCLGEGNTDNCILPALVDSKEYVAAQLGQLPAQLLEHAVGNLQPRVRQQPWGLSIRATRVLVEPDLINPSTVRCRWPLLWDSAGSAVYSPRGACGWHEGSSGHKGFKCCGNTLHRTDCFWSPGGVAVSSQGLSPARVCPMGTCCPF